MEERDYVAITRHLVERVIGRCSGAAEDRCIHDLPRDRYFVGSLSTPNSLMSGPRTRVSPSALGLVVRVRGEGSTPKLMATVRFSVYYRVFPTYEEQLSRVGESQETAAKTDDNGAVEMALAFKRLDIEVPDIIFEVPSPGASDGSVATVTEEIAKALDAARTRVASDPDTIRVSGRGAPKIPRDALSTKDAFMSWVRDTAANGRTVVPDWRAALSAETRHDGDCLRVTVRLENRGQETSGALEDRYLYDCSVELSVRDGKFFPFTFSFAPTKYGDKRRYWGQGVNCSIEAVDPEAPEAGVRTVTAPRFDQRRQVTPPLDGVDLRFSVLARDPLPQLRALQRAMEKYAERWARFFPERGDLEGFRDEIDRFRKAVDALESVPMLRRAFELTNAAFEELDLHREQPLVAWRPFQVVFVVSQVPDLASREFPDLFSSAGMDWVDVLWFPTGGGKTEAYVGVILFSAFFDRLRGKRTGTTAWVRFPLRLLTSQQLQRIANAVASAESVRERTPEVSDSERFSVGFFVGKSSIPNKWRDIPAEVLEDPQSLRKEFLLVAKCPFCAERRVEVYADRDLERIVHICRACGRELPLYGVDEEIYRYLPTVVVGTIDKLAIFGVQRHFSLLFGAARFRCPKHGYTHLEECLVKTCRERLEPCRLKDPSPSLEVQDELHLLREGVGTFDAHYESMLQVYQHAFAGARMKVIASTATLDDTLGRQVNHLYSRRARRFPAESWSDEESFYSARSAAVQRTFVGILPVNKTHIDAQIELLGFYQEELHRLRSDPVEAVRRLGLGITPDELATALDLYELKVSYVRSRDDGDLIERSVVTQLNPRLRRHGAPEVRSKLLIGDTAFDEVQDILDRLQHPPSDPEERIDGLTATDTISHGVDVDRLNTMFFYGIPRSTAQYIQVSSRAGRRYPGIVFVCYNTIAERDQSQFGTFVKYHQFLDALVEPVPIDRWSRYSVRRTIPGAFQGLLLNLFGPRAFPRYGIRRGGEFDIGNTVRKAMREGVLDAAAFRTLLEQVYRTFEPDGNAFRVEVQRWVEEFFRQLAEPDYEYVYGVLDPRPMVSLRDVEVQLEFERTRGA